MLFLITVFFAIASGVDVLATKANLNSSPILISELQTETLAYHIL